MLRRAVHRRLVILSAMAASAIASSACDRADPAAVATPASAPAAAALVPSAPNAPPDDAVVAEVLGNIRRQPVGDHTVGDLDLPEPFLRRIADRVIRESYQDRFHVVYADGPPDPPADVAATGRGGAGPGSVSVVRAALPAAVIGARKAMPEARPPRSGFRAPILGAAADIERAVVPPDAAPTLPEATLLVGRRLAHDGLLATTVRAIERLGPDDFVDRPDALRANLRAAGLPLDLLRFFDVTRGRSSAGARPPLVRPDRAETPEVTICRALAAGTSALAFLEAGAAPFRFEPTQPGFRVMSESGEHDIGLLRAQLTRGTYWRAPGAGGSVDLLRQLVAELPDVDFVVSIERRHLDGFRELVSSWPLARGGRLTIAAEPLAVAQWAQDNGKGGVIDADGGPPRLGTMLPRYASRRDDGSVFIPGESFLADGLAATGLELVHSPLVFQGGNLMAVRDPATSERILLVGEAEVYRNTALGLTREQALAAFRAEFGVHRCEVLPSVSFHIDYDVCVRAHDGELIAFVNDRPAAVRLVLAAGIDALARGGVLDETEARTLRERLAADRLLDVVNAIGPRLAQQVNQHGQYPLSFARHFAAGAVDSPTGNLQRFLVAMDVAAAMALAPEDGPRHAQVRAYLDALRRAEMRRRDLHARLRALGWRVVPVPSLSEAGRSLTYVNGIHDRTRYVMPAYGGLYAGIDAAAASVFEEVLGPGVRVIPVLSGESQRRSGAVHCAVSVYPRVTP